MNDLSWRVRRAAARWLFVERRMELVGEEVHLPTETYTTTRGSWNGQPLALPSHVRQVDVLGLTRAGHATSSRRPIGLRAIEVKIGRSDFVAGVKKGQIGNGPGGIGSVVDYAHLLTAEGVRVDLGELPEGWGLLIAREVDSMDEPPRKVIRIEQARPAKRLTPTFAVDHERVAHSLAQSALWRLYSYRSQLTVTRDADTGENGDRSRREIAT